MNADVIDFAELRAQRSPYWRPGMNPQNEPWAALAETNVGHVLVPCGTNQAYAREVVARWKIMSESGLTQQGRVMVGACVVDPRGEIHEMWRLEGVGSVPLAGEPPRWVPLSVASEWTTCTGCGNRRGPGHWLVVGGGGCSICQPLRETADPRVWPEERKPLTPDPETRAQRTVRVATYAEKLTAFPTP